MTSAAVKSRGLGKGLSALLGDSKKSGGISDSIASSPSNESAHELSVDDVHPWELQPRQRFNAEELAELSDSIAKNGVVQPIVVRPDSDGGYEIIAGERRWRAAKMAGLKTIPVIHMELNDERAMEIALIENIQRKDLTPIEMADSYQHLLDAYDYTQEKLADVLGKSRVAITNTLRLRNLPDKVKALVSEEKLSAGHARALVGSKFAEQAAAKIIKDGLNVRQTERLIKRLGDPVTQPNDAKSSAPSLPSPMEKSLSKALSVAVRVTHNKSGGGKIVIQCDDEHELARIAKRISRK